MLIQADELNPNVKAFLKVIQHAEGTDIYDNPYNHLFGGGVFDSYESHPDITVRLPGYKSTAAGAYQILKRTADSLGMTTFYPSDQDRAAVQLIKRRNAYNAVLSGDVDTAIDLCNEEWASLPGSPYGQPTKTMAELKAVFMREKGVAGAIEVFVPVTVVCVLLFSLLKITNVF